MNLCSLAVRLAAVGALTGATWAGDRVYNQPIDPLVNFEGATAPLIAVFTGDSLNKPEHSDLLSGDRTIDVVVQIYVPTEVTLPGGVKIDGVDKGGEIILELVGRQIEAALLRGGNPWAKLWRQFVLRIHDANSRPYLIQPDKGARIVAREIVLSVDTLAAPPFAAPEGAWADLIVAIAGDATLAGLAPLVDAAIRGGDAMPGWKTAASLLGLREGVARGIGLAPADATETGEPAAATKITIDGLYPAPTEIEHVGP